MRNQVINTWVGDCRVAFTAIVLKYGKPEDLSSLTAKVLVINSSDTTVVTETTTNVSAQSTFTVTANATTNRITAANHRVQSGDRVVFATTGTIPSGLTAATKYYARDVDDDSFRVSATFDGSPIDIASAGSGTHTAYIVGEVMWIPSSGHVTTAGDYRIWFRCYSSSLPSSYPLTEGIPWTIRSRTYSG
jgi:hypothetical protein